MAIAPPCARCMAQQEILERPVNTEVPYSRGTRPHRHAHVARRTGRPRPPTAATLLWIGAASTGYDYGKEHGSIRSPSACFKWCHSSWMSGTVTVISFGRVQWFGD